MLLIWYYFCIKVGILCKIIKKAIFNANKENKISNKTKWKKRVDRPEFHLFSFIWCVLFFLDEAWKPVFKINKCAMHAFLQTKNIWPINLSKILFYAHLHRSHRPSRSSRLTKTNAIIRRCSLSHVHANFVHCHSKCNVTLYFTHCNKIEHLSL